MNAHRSCAVCGHATTMWCSRCQNSWYCSPEHLQSDWQRHRRDCVAVASPQGDPAASPSPAQLITVSALLLSPEEQSAKVINVQCRPQGSHSQGLSPLPLIQQHFTEGVPHTIILTQGLGGEPLRFPLHIWYCPIALQRGSPVNRAIYRITSGAATKAWCGPVIVFKFNGSRRQGYMDATTNDLPALSAYFLAYK